MTTQKNASTEFALRRVFISDLSLESPKAPEAFESNEAPQLDVQLNVKHKVVRGNHMVTLKVTVRAMHDKDTIFLIEVDQSGLFTANGFDEETLHKVLNIHCPSLLYPYASAFISDLVFRAGFMPLYLPAVDFNAMYEQQREAQRSQDA